MVNITLAPLPPARRFTIRRDDMTTNTFKWDQLLRKACVLNLDLPTIAAITRTKIHQQIDAHSRPRHCRMNNAPPIARRAHILVKLKIQETLSSNINDTLIRATVRKNKHNPRNLHNHHCKRCPHQKSQSSGHATARKHQHT